MARAPDQGVRGRGRARLARRTAHRRRRDQGRDRAGPAEAPAGTRHRPHPVLPGAGKMAHHYGDEETSLAWSRVSNDLIARVCGLFPDRFAGVCQLPQSPGDALAASVRRSAAELERCVEELGFVGCLLNPDPSDGYWQAPPLTDRVYYPLYEKMAELDVPAMVHVAMSRNPAVQGTCAHYLNGDTAVFMQLCQSELFKDFPTLRLIIPHGGGAVPYHWGRYRGSCGTRADRRLRRPCSATSSSTPASTTGAAWNSSRTSSPPKTCCSPRR
ncbi:amidohydrolase family protein [Streptomyces sp. M19]